MESNKIIDIVAIQKKTAERNAREEEIKRRVEKILEEVKERRPELKIEFRGQWESPDNSEYIETYQFICQFASSAYGPSFNVTGELTADKIISEYNKAILKFNINSNE